MLISTKYSAIAALQHCCIAKFEQTVPIHNWQHQTQYSRNQKTVLYIYWT